MLFRSTKKTVMTIIFIGLWLLIIFGVEITAASNKFVRLLIDPGFLYFLTYFMAGSCMFLYKESLVYSNIWAGFIGLSLFLGTWSGSLLQIMPVILPISLYFLAVKLPLKEFGQKTDLSYGIFLIINSLINKI